jgi:lipoprotein-anchoring transpeptidase ErfK/SrfK
MSTPLLTIVMMMLLQAATPSPQRTPPKAHAPVSPAPAPGVGPDVLAMQVMLDRAGFSPGVIDGHPGENTDKALAVYKETGGDPAAVPADAVVQYTVTTEDATGPYAPDLPTDLMALSKVPALTYRTPLEALAERFHSTPALLQRLNPGARFAAGEVIDVPNVAPLVLPVDRLPDAGQPAGQRRTGTTGTRGASAQSVDKPVKPDVIVSVSKSMSALRVKDDAGRVIFYAPVTTGSEHDPLPIGEWKVRGVQFNPTFRYNPDLFWDADPTHTKAIIPAGPNNPVGLVWIDLSKDHYGIHGTPEPSAIGHTESHGCVRLTNWDALKLAGLVKTGTRVIFAE